MRMRGAVTGICAFSRSLLIGVAGTAILAMPARAQEAADPVPTDSAADPLSIELPPPPPDAQLPVIEPIISDDEFTTAIPPLDASSDPELNRPLESIYSFERNLAQERATPPTQEGAAPPLGDPALADGDQVEEIGDAPVRDAELAAPLPPLETFEVKPVEFADADASDEEIVEVRYGVAINGLDDVDTQTPTDMRGEFEGLSALEGGDGKAANVAQVSARLSEDSKLLEQILASEGWYSAAVQTRIDRSADVNGQPLSAVIDVTAGKRYELAEINIVADPTTPPNLIADNLLLKTGEPIVAARVQGAEAQVAVALPENGYPFAKVGQRDILLDDQTGDGIYTLPVDVGPRSRFGGITTSGNQAFDAEHVGVLARFDRGELYDSRKLDDLRQALVATGLFNTVTAVPEQTGEAADADTQYVNIAVEQDAGPPRALTANAGFGTGQGFRVSGSWAHRNLFPPEGALIATAVAGTQEQGASATFRRSNAGQRDRSFSIIAEALHSDYDAYTAFTGRLAARVSYDSTPIWQKPLTYAYGAQILATREDDFNPVSGIRESRTFFIGGLTGQVGFDRSDSLLNPTKGFRLTALIEPEGSLQGGFTPYVRTRVDGSAYFPFGQSIVLAGRVAAGSIQGVDTFDIAPSRRFYGGGGGSVRGFGYQQLGPQTVEPNPDFDPTDDESDEPQFLSRPIGGRSFNEAAAEVRYRFGDYGIVGFVDAGQVYDASFPQLSDIRFGVGIGGRFYTNFGPFRLDLATPIGRREGESLINVYVSIGQAF